jgi:hypothetical protein
MSRYEKACRDFLGYSALTLREIDRELEEIDKLDREVDLPKPFHVARENLQKAVCEQQRGIPEKQCLVDREDLMALLEDYERIDRLYRDLHWRMEGLRK